MPPITLQLIVFVVAVGLYTLTAAVSDMRTRRIPNVLTVPVFFAGLIYQGAFNHLEGLKDAGWAFLVGFGLLLVLWLIGGGGGGDVKLMGALSVWLGLKLTVFVMIGSTICVVLGTMAIMIWTALTGGMTRAKKRFAAYSKPEPEGEIKPQESVEQRQKRRIMAFAVPVAVATWVVVIFKLPDFPFLGP